MYPVFEEARVSNAFESLLAAIRDRDDPAAKEAVHESPAVASESDETGQTALHHAAHGGQADIVDLLIAAGADVHARTVTGYTPLHYAAYGGSSRAFERLIDADADILAIDDSRTTMLHAAASGGSREIVDVVLEAGIPPGALNVYGEAPAHRAAQRNRLDIVKHLIERGADPAPVDRYELTLLHKAAIGGAVETLDWLIDQGHDTGVLNLAGETPLHAAAELGRTTAVEALISRGADVQCRTHEGATPLHAASGGEQAEMIRTLLDAGVDPHATDELGRTAMHRAAIRGQAEILPILVESGASAETPDAEGLTALDLATVYGRTEARGVLSERAEASSRFDPEAVAALVSQTVGPGEARIWYLGHSGWAIRTENHWLVIDYAPGEPDREDAGLLNGRIRAAEFADVPTLVFVTHHHPDHFDRQILAWQEAASVNYVFGWQAPEDLPGLRFATRGEGRVDEAVIRAIPATDAGSAFLIEADGARIYHAGDHTASRIPPEPGFADGVDWLTERCPQVDIAFLPVFGCGLPETDALRAGNRYTIDRLRPRTVFPMHVGWTGYFYRRFAAWAKDTGIQAQLGIADQPGDRFRLRNGRLEKV